MSLTLVLLVLQLMSGALNGATAPEDETAHARDMIEFWDYMYHTNIPPNKNVLIRLDQYSDEHPEDVNAAIVSSHIRKNDLVDTGEVSADWAGKQEIAFRARQPHAVTLVALAKINTVSDLNSVREGEDLLKEAMRLGDPFAFYNHAALVLSLNQTRENVDALHQAETDCRRAIELGCTIARLPLARILVLLHADEEAVATLQQQADAGDPIAKAELSDWYQTGHHMKISNECAFELLRDAVTLLPRTRPDFRRRLGEMYRAGLGVPQDLRRARELFHSAWGGGDKSAGRDLAKACLFGEGGEVDIDTGLMLTQKTAEAGFADSQAMLARFYLEGLFVPRDISQARIWFQRAADHGGSLSSVYLKWLDEPSVVERLANERSIPTRSK